MLDIIIMGILRPKIPPPLKLLLSETHHQSRDPGDTHKQSKACLNVKVLKASNP